jgi:hypothetical protein
VSSLSEEEKAEARRIFAAGGDDSRICSFCGGFHLRACPRVSSFELYENGKLKSVQFWCENQWDSSFIVWPEDAGDDDAEGGDDRDER